MATAALTDVRPQRFHLIRSFAELFALAMRYERLFDLSDAELAARGQTRETLAKRFIDEAGEI